MADLTRGRTIDEIKETLEAYLALFSDYASIIFGRTGGPSQDQFQPILSRLRRTVPEVAQIVTEVLGDSSVTFGSMGFRQTASTTDMMTAAVAGGNNALPLNFNDYEALVSSMIERTLGALESGMWPPEQTSQQLVIRDEQLRARCADLLEAGGVYDRVIQEATRVLEDRIRSRVPHETLSSLIPNSGDQIGENLVNRVFSVDTPVLSTSDDRIRRIALRNILIGVVSYLRNPSHHQIDDQTEISWAWSTVGLIDRLLLDIESCDVTG